VLREPGAITAWRTPSRTHWSTRVAHIVAAAVTTCTIGAYRGR
jgi:hypothetical protein